MTAPLPAPVSVSTMLNPPPNIDSTAKTTSTATRMASHANTIRDPNESPNPNFNVNVKSEQPAVVDQCTPLGPAFDPTSTSTPTLSDLQKLVKNARASIIDPIISSFSISPPSPSPSSEDDQEPTPQDPLHRRRLLEREKIQELKQHKIRSACSLSLPASSLAGQLGVWVRRDVGDESGVVDIDIDDDYGNSRESEGTQTRERAEGNDGEEEMYLQQNGADDEEQVQSVPVVVGAMRMSVDVPVEVDVGRTRKPSRKLRSRLKDGEAGVENAKSKSKRAPTTKVTLKVKIKPPPRPLPETVSVSGSAAPSASGIPGSRVQERDHIENEGPDEDAEIQSPIHDAEEDEDELPSFANTSSGKSKPSKQTKSRVAKPPPETYKQPWSMSEQNLLEGLLERFGDGEKFRYVFPRSFWFWFSVFCVVWYELFLVLFFVLRGVPTSFRLPYPFSLIEVNLDRLMTFR